MAIDTSIFKEYDVRGVYPETINYESAVLIGRAFPGLGRGVAGRRAGPRLFVLVRVVVGRDPGGVGGASREQDEQRSERDP